MCTRCRARAPRASEHVLFSVVVLCETEERREREGEKAEGEMDLVYRGGRGRERKGEMDLVY